MPIGEIKEKYFLSPREAIAFVVWPETFGTDWSDEIPLTAPDTKTAVRNLLKALESGQVDAFFHCGDGRETKLTAAEAANEFFEIDLAKDACFLRADFQRPWCLKINRSQLENFMKKFRPSETASSARAMSACERWLTEIFKKEERPPSRDELFTQASAKFEGLSRNSYNTARRNALVVSGREDLKRGGAPRGPRKNRTGEPK